MKQKIKETFFVLMIFTGLVTCMCEVPDFGVQIATMCVGLGLIALGAIGIAAGVDEDVLFE